MQWKQTEFGVYRSVDAPSDALKTKLTMSELGEFISAEFHSGIFGSETYGFSRGDCLFVYLFVCVYASDCLQIVYVKLLHEFGVNHIYSDIRCHLL